MDLYVLRHAIAVERGTPGYEDDSQRPLTGKGAKRMRLVAEGMLGLELSFDVILSSPFLRAKQTAEIVAEVFGVPKKLKSSKHLEVGGDPEALIDEINDKYGSRSSILLVGHEPYLSGLISMLISGNEDVPITMKKGGLCKLTVSALRYGQCATLEWLLAPRQMTQIQ
ncbi:MAG: phosphohistidine phosphatase SixA [Bacteroidetes bacterium]|nr:phosphohistidine phosphatase SixA [Bacteroidota bacterium]